MPALLRLLFVLCLVLVTVGSALPALAAEPVELTVMTFNLRFASERPPNAWPERRPVVRELIENYQPDIIGTQEGVYHQLQDIDQDLPGYEWLGLGREGGSRGEFMAVFYRPERLKPLEFDHYWLSDTPEVIGSKSWGNNVVRMVTWVKFLDKQSGRRFYFINTHFDHQVQASREKSAELLRERAGRLDPELPVILVGDFNAAAEQNKVYDLLVGSGAFHDAWKLARERRNEVGTFHNYAGPRPDGARIDWILVNRPAEVEWAEVITYKKDGQYPSDHFPVIARLRLPGSAQ